MRVFFSHPTVTFRTDTEDTCISMISEAFDPDKIFNPSNYGLKDDLRSIIHEADVVVGMAILNKYTFLVWNEMKEGKAHGADLYTIRVKNKERIGGIEEGMLEEISELPKDESNQFTQELMKESRESLMTLLFGNWGSKSRF